MGQVTALPGQPGRETMANDSIPRSLLEPPAGQRVGHFAQQWLVARVAPPQRIKADAPGVEIDLGADQAVGPRGVDLEVAAQQLGPAGRPGAPQVNDSAARPGLEIQGPAL